ncbi:MAG: metallophosphoesterase [Pseudomonadota bacterium]
MLSDVHLNPFVGGAVDKEILAAPVSRWPSLYSAGPKPVSNYGADATVPLFQSAVQDAASRVPAPDFILYPGDFLTHGLPDKVKAASGRTDAKTLHQVAVDTTKFLALELRHAFVGVPILPALGNTDSACGDYQVEPGGSYLSDTWPMVQELVGTDRLAEDAEKTWRAGGYYRAAHPTVKNAQVVVLNNILWSERFENQCGGGNVDTAGDAMLDWLGGVLGGAERRGEVTWLIYHIPPGINAYNTAHAAPGECRDDTAVYWRERYRKAFAALMERHGARVLAAFSGHIHRDSFRLFTSSGGVEAATTIAPSISPIFGNNPAYQVFRYDPKTGALSDKTTYFAENLSAAAADEAPLAWRELYQFSQSYGGKYGKAELAGLAKTLETPDQSAGRTLYSRFYGAGHGEAPSGNWPVFGCAPGHIQESSFNDCRCAR